MAFGGVDRLRWMHAQPCIVATYGLEASECEGAVVTMHVISRGAGGRAEHAVPACHKHHIESHNVGILTFAHRYGLNWRMALDLYNAMWRLASEAGME